MKNIFSITLIVISISLKSNAQNHNGSKVVSFKHSQQIDSLLNEYIVEQNKLNEKNLSFIMSLGTRSDTVVVVSIAMETNKVINAMMNVAFKRNESLGFFEYKHFYVFVTKAINVGDFFIETNKFKRFDFLKLNNKYELPRLEDIQPGANYIYKNKKFTLDW